MKCVPGFTAMIGKLSFVKGIEADYPEETLKFLDKCKLNDGSKAYPFEVVKEKTAKADKKIIKGDK